MDIRSQILDGTLTLPNFNAFVSNFGKEEADTANNMFKAAWYSYLLNKGSISLTYWAEQFNSMKVFNLVLKVMSKNSWLTSHSIPARNWAEAQMNENKLLEYVTPDELAHVRASRKFTKYIPEDLESKIHNLTKQNGKVRNTGLIRYGLKASAASKFMYDTNYLDKYKEAIILNTTKGMQKVREKFPEMASDEASYDAVSAAIIEELSGNPSTYSMGNNFSDSRGRAIKQGLSKVANPIGYKDFRALLVIPEEHRNVATEEGAKAIYLFIAELHGFKDGSLLDKELFGVECYNSRKLHNLTIESRELTARIVKELITDEEIAEANEAITDTEFGSLDYEYAVMQLESLISIKNNISKREHLRAEEDRKELHENIWLERLYDELDAYNTQDIHHWSTPIELDASASMLSHMGLLLGDKRLLAMTNTLDTGILNDPWYFEGINRTMFKHAATPMLYGSSKSCYELWQDKGHEYTTEQIKLFTKELESGALGLANDFKNFIIRWVKPKEEMVVNVYEDTFKIECNRFRNVGEVTVRYDIYDSIEDTVRRISHTKVKRVPDLDQFKRWFVTGLIHAQDSQVLDFVMEKIISSYGWGMDIHDAIIICPEAAKDTRQWYAEELQVIYNNRETILNRYFKSIGIGNEAIADWNKLMAKVQKVENFVASPMALK